MSTALHKGSPCVSPGIQSDPVDVGGGPVAELHRHVDDLDLDQVPVVPVVHPSVPAEDASVRVQRFVTRDQPLAGEDLPQPRDDGVQLWTCGGLPRSERAVGAPEDQPVAGGGRDGSAGPAACT